MDKTQYTLNKAYNLFLTQVILWDGLTNKINADKSMGYNPIKNKDKMINCYEKALGISQHLDLSDLTVYKSYYSNLDDKALITKFMDTLQ